MIETGILFLVFFSFFLFSKLLAFYYIASAKNISFFCGMRDIFHAIFASLAIVGQNWVFMGLTTLSFAIYYFPNFLIKIFKLKEI